MLDTERLLEETPALGSGWFSLAKEALIMPGVNVPRTNRCDNLAITGIAITQNTEYQGQAFVVGKSSDYSSTILHAKAIRKIEYPIHFSPNFLIAYLEVDPNSEGMSVGIIDLQIEPTPSVMWAGRSIYQLFKNIREWSFMVDEPFSSDHPMATYSKLVLESLNPPQQIIDEIDSMPDMHLAKFLKGQSDYKIIPNHPSISQSFKDWIILKSQQYPFKPFEEQL